MLLKPERALITGELTSLLQASTSVPVTISTIFGGDAASVLPQIPANIQSHTDAAVRIVGACLMDRWTKNPSLLETLLSNLIGRGMKVAELTPLRARVIAKVDPNLDPLMSSWIDADRPFFGRAPSRTAVQTLLDSAAAPILLVQGAGGSGKSYTSKWLNFVSDPDRCDFRIVVFELEKKTGPTMEPDVLAEALVSKMGQPLNHGVNATMNRYEQRLCNWIVSSALAPLVGGPVGRTWIVLDGFDDPDLHEGSKKLIQLLAEAVMSGDLNRRVRLVLLDFKSKLIKADIARIKCDGLPDPDIVDAKQLELCLHQHFADIEQPVEDQFIKDLAAQLVVDALARRADADAQDKPRLELINEEVSDLRQRDLRRIGRIA